MSTHSVKVVRLSKPKKHPNADALEIFDIEGCNCISRLGEHKEGDLAVYIEPDYVVPDTEQFAFLQGHRRIKTKRLRGIWSMGLLLPPPVGTAEGDDVMAAMGIVRYEPEMRMARGTGGEAESPPAGFFPHYDMESLRKHKNVLHDGERVYITEKIHGASARYMFQDDRMWVSSHREWKRRDEKILWWRALEQNPWIEGVCRANPELCLYGEVFGQVQDLTYGAGPDQIFFKVFDVWQKREARFLNYTELLEVITDTAWHVPVIAVQPYSYTELEPLAEGQSLLANNLQEGIVVKPVIERVEHIGRVIFKLVSNQYLSRKSG
jgi:RNA ligase (TIGR02306 family)